MFSFTTQDPDQNTPFFQDNSNEQPSLFNSQQSEEPSAFDLFNSRGTNEYHDNFNSNFQYKTNSHNNSHSHDSDHLDKLSNRQKNYVQERGRRKGRESKKSIIMELDQEFDRREAVKELEELYNSEMQNQNIQYHNLVQSQVKHFQSGQKLYNQSSQLFNNQLSNSTAQENNKKFAPNKLQFNFDKRQQSKTNNKEQQLQKPKSHIMTNFTFKNNKKQQQNLIKSNVTKQQIISQHKVQQPKADKLNFEQQFSFNHKLPPKQSSGLKQNPQQITSQAKIKNQSQSSKLVNNNILNKLKAKDNISKIEGQQLRINPQKQAQIEKKTTFSSNFSFAGLKNSRVQNVEQKLNTTINLQTNQTNIKNNSPAKFQFTGLNNTLKRSAYKDSVVANVNQNKQSMIIENNKSTKVNQYNEKQTKPIETKKFAFGNKHSEQITLNKVDKPEKSSHSFFQSNTKPLMPIHQQGTSVIQPKQGEEKVKQKQKEKPRFNLRSIKQPKSEKQRNMEQQVHAVVKQQITKRQQNTTAKLLKNITFGKGLSFGNFANQTKEPQNTSVVEQKSKQITMRQITPKITKIQSKSMKNINVRETQKMKQNQKLTQQNLQQNKEQTSQQSEFRTHRIDFEKYQNEIFSIADQIDQTKKKYSACDNGYKNIFILVNQANMMLSQKFMSQTQKSTQKPNRQQRQKANKQWKDSQVSL